MSEIIARERERQKKNKKKGQDQIDWVQSVVSEKDAKQKVTVFAEPANQAYCAYGGILSTVYTE